MRKMVAVLLAGMTLPFALPALAARTLRDDGGPVKPPARLKIEGKLGPLLGHRARDTYSAEVTAGGATYRLLFSRSPRQVETAKRLEGQSVIVTGVSHLDDERVIVQELRAVTPR